MLVLEYRNYVLVGEKVGEGVQNSEFADNCLLYKEADVYEDGERVSWITRVFFNPLTK